MSVNILVPDFRDEGLLVLCTTRKNDPSMWSFPGGKVDHGESPAIAAARELYEETGVSMVPNMLTPVFTALDSDGWICTTFLANTCQHFRDGKLQDLVREQKFTPEEGMKVEWFRARDLLDREISPFAAYYLKMFTELNFLTALGPEPFSGT